MLDVLTMSVRISIADLLFCCVMFGQGMGGDMIAVGLFCGWVMYGYYRNFRWEDADVH